MTMTMTMMISRRKSVVVGVGHKPTEVKSWQVPPLSSPPACHHLFVFLPINWLYFSSYMCLYLLGFFSACPSWVFKTKATEKFMWCGPPNGVRLGNPPQYPPKHTVVAVQTHRQVHRNAHSGCKQAILLAAAQHWTPSIWPKMTAPTRIVFL